jgi:hypothetical protein
VCRNPQCDDDSGDSATQFDYQFGEFWRNFDWLLYVLIFSKFFEKHFIEHGASCIFENLENVISKILQGLVARHMYMFSLSAPERHALSSTVGIDIHGQRGIELRSSSHKKLPNSQSVIRHPKSLIARLQESFLANNESVRDRLAKAAKKKED